MSADTKQVGGAHYKVEGELQHWNVVAAMGWDYFVGNATKYLWRLGKKGGPEKELEDLQKAIHYLEKKQELLRAKLAQGSVGQEAVKATGYETPKPYGTIPKSAEWEKWPARLDGNAVAHPYGASMPVSREDLGLEDGGPTRAYVHQD